jgi:hypothetical protein
VRIASQLPVVSFGFVVQRAMELNLEYFLSNERRRLKGKAYMFHGRSPESNFLVAFNTSPGCV